jgi:drug/metabolite transporter (DMT)-like permease
VPRTPPRPRRPAPSSRAGRHGQIGAPLLAAIALSIAGVGALELGDSELPGVGDLWAMGQPIGFGAAFWKTNAMMRQFPTQTLPITAVQVLGAGSISLVWMLWEAWSKGHLDASLLDPVLSSPTVAGSIVYLGVVTTAITRIGETKALGSVSSGDASILMTTEPLWAAVFGSLLMNENLGLSAWVGGGLILAACLVNMVEESQVEEWKAKIGLAGTR